MNHSILRHLSVCLLASAWVFANPAAGQFWGGDAKQEAPEVGWDRLITLNYQTGDFPPELGAINGENIKLPGFVVPLALVEGKLKEFLLVPSYGYCIHVPPPPPNQMVHVTREEPVGLEVVRFVGHFSAPVWVTGRLQIAEANSMYGVASFSFTGNAVDPYPLE
ncbi:MAG: DUF3299 domain-containing protein [Candidatus Competibacterales bacterium]